MGLRVYLQPEPDTRPDAVGNGIQQVVQAMYKYLPEHGIEFVSSRDRADLYAAHVDSNAGTPDVLHCHGLYPTGELEIGRWAYEVNARVIANALVATSVTTPSPWVSEIFARNMGFLPKAIRHGIEPEIWPEPPTRQALSVLFNKNRPGDVCAVEPMERLAQIRPNYQFISTFGTARKNLTVTGTMPFPAMQNLLYQSGIYYAPTKETYGIGILEAMAAGMPVLTWNWGNAPELVRHQIDGYVVEPYDHMGAARGLDWCMEHFDEVSRAARARALTFTWEDPIQEYAELYQAIVTRRQQQQGPMISVIIPCYNYQAYVKEAIASVRSQTWEDWECIVVDDGSTDDSLAAIREVTGNDVRFKVVSQANSKVAKARNRGALMSRGRYLCFLDADDFLLPRALELLVGEILVHPEVGIVYGSLESLIIGEDERQKGAWPDAFDARKQVSRRNQIPACCLIDSRAFFRAGGFRTHAIPAEDAELWTRIVLLGFQAMKATEESTYVYRRHGESATADINVRGGRPEPNWVSWLPASNGGQQPMASVVPAQHASHPVFNYERPMVSFVTPVGPDHAALVPDAIESVSAQIDHRWEHIIVDDTEEGNLQTHGDIPYAIRYPYLRWVRSPKLHNVSAARNAGAQAARGKYLCFLDADDMLFKEFIRTTLPIIQENPRALVYTDWMELPEIKLHETEPWDMSKLLDHALFAVTFLHSKNAFIDVGGFDEHLDIWEDWDYTVRLGLIGAVGIRVPQPLLSYRYHTGKRREESLAKAQERIRAHSAKPGTTTSVPVPTPAPTPPTRPRNEHLVAKPAQPVPEPPIPAGHIKIRYIGDFQGTRLFRSSTSGRKYRFGTGPHAIKAVFPEDLPYFQSLTGMFEVLEVVHGM